MSMSRMSRAIHNHYNDTATHQNDNTDHNNHNRNHHHNNHNNHNHNSTPTCLAGATALRPRPSCGGSTLRSTRASSDELVGKRI